jgi:hypothetical protein
MNREEIITYFDKFSDEDLFQMTMELQMTSVPLDAKVRTCCIDVFGNDTLINLIGIGTLLCKPLAERMKLYSEFTDPN